MWPHPVERDGQQEDERRVVSEQVPSHHGHERGVEAAEQPYALVEDPHVVAGSAVAVVHRDRKLPEPQHVGADQGRHGQVAQEAAAHVVEGALRRARVGPDLAVDRNPGHAARVRERGVAGPAPLAHRYHGVVMSVFSKILRAGEGKKVRALQALVPDINELEASHQGPERRGPGSPDGRVPGAAGPGRGRQRPARRRLRDHARGGLADHRPAPLRRAADGRRRPALRLDRRDEDRRGQDAGVDPAGLPQRPDRRAASTWSPSTTTWPAATPSGWARSTAFSASTSAGYRPDIDDWQAKKDAYACDVTYGTNTEFGFDYLRDNMARSLEHMVQRGHPYAIVDEVDSILIDEARTPLIISGPSSDSARLYYQFAGVARSLTREVDYEVDEEKRTVAPTEAGHREGRAGPGHRQPLRPGLLQLRPPADPGPEGQGAVQTGQGLHRRRRRGEDRRRVHRPHPRGPALVRRSAPGGGGQGAGHHQGGEPHLGHGDPAELFPALREAGRA